MAGNAVAGHAAARRRWSLLIGLSLAGCLFSASLAFSAPIETLRSGGWTGGRYPAERSKPFQYCSASAKNNKDITISLSLDRNFQWKLAFSHPQWSFQNGSSVAMVLGLTQIGQSFAGAATVSNSNTLEFRTEDSLGLFASLWTATQLKAVAGGFSFEFELLSGSDVLSALTECAWRQARKNTRARPGGAQADIAPAMRDEAKGVADMIVSYARSALSREAPPTSQPGDRGAAKWQAGPVTGTVDVLPGKDARQPDDVVMDMIEKDVRGCHGAFFFVKSAQVVDATTLGRSFVLCQAPEASTANYHVIVPRSKGGVYLLSSGVNMSINSAAIQKRLGEIDAKVREVALTAIDQAQAEHAKADDIAK